MASWTAYDLTPRAPFHFGERGVGVETTLEWCHADTVFSALCSVIADLEGAQTLGALLAEFIQGDPPFLLSSAYPRAGDVRLLPRPALRWSGGPDDTPDAGALLADKALKRVRLLSWGLFGVWVGGRPSPAFEAPQVAHGEQIWLTPGDLARAPQAIRGRWWRVDAVPRVTIDRRTAASTIYHCGRVAFAPECGLHFLVWWRRHDWTRVIERALTALGDAGLGGERSAGYGQFSWAASDPGELPSWQGATGFVTLAPYCPTVAELESGALGAGAAWELLPRFGWTASGGRGVRHREVTMLAEGSAICTPIATDTRAGNEPTVMGRLVEVTPDGFGKHPVYRYGFAFPWPAGLQA